MLTDEDWEQVLEAAVAAEQERCARVCETAHDAALREAGMAKAGGRPGDAAEWLQRIIAYQNAANLIRKG